MNNLVVELTEELQTPASLKMFDGVWNPGVIENGPDEYAILSDLTWNVTVTNTGDAFLVAGSISGPVKSTCGRCLEDFTINVNGSVEGYYSMDASATEAPEEDMGPDELLTLIDGNKIDLEPLLMAAVLIELPLVALCDEECLGLCPHCGKNLNEGPCDCESEPEEEDFSNNPFAVLKNLNLGED